MKTNIGIKGKIMMESCPMLEEIRPFIKSKKTKKR